MAWDVFRGSLDAHRPLGEIDLSSAASNWDHLPNWRVELVDGHVDVHRRLVADVGFGELGRVVDIGSGFGRLALHLAERNDEVIAVDRDTAAVRLGNDLAQRFGLDGLRFVPGDAASLPIETASADGAWFYSALQFMDRGQALAEARRVLKPGGRLFVGRYNTTWVIIEKYLTGWSSAAGRQSSQCDWVRRALSAGTDHDGGANWLTMATASQVLERHGFVVDDSHGVVVTPPWGPSVDPGLRAVLEDPAALLDQLERNDAFVETLVTHRDRLLLTVPGNIAVVAAKG